MYLNNITTTITLYTGKEGSLIDDVTVAAENSIEEYYTRVSGKDKRSTTQSNWRHLEDKMMGGRKIHPTPGSLRGQKLPSKISLGVEGK